MNWSNQYGLTGTASISLAHWARDLVSGLNKGVGFRDRMETRIAIMTSSLMCREKSHFPQRAPFNES